MTVVGVLGLEAALKMAVFGLPAVPSTAWASWTCSAEGPVLPD